MFRFNVGRYPKTLNELLEAPKAEAEAAKWKGPYVTDSEALKDPWKHELRFRFPGKHNETKYDLWSTGPDGADGTDDDVTNWSRP